MRRTTRALALALFVQGIAGSAIRAQAALETKSFLVTPGDTLALSDDFGKVRIRPAAGSNLEIKIQRTSQDSGNKNTPGVITRRAASTIFVSATYSGAAGEAVDFDIQAPAFLNLTISGANPEVDVSSISGVVRVQDAAGRVSAENLTSATSLVTDTGDIVYRAGSQPKGDVRLESTTGIINCEFVGDLNLRSTIRAGGKIFWDMDPTVEGASVEKQLGASGPSFYAGSLKGNVIVRLIPGLAGKAVVTPVPAVAAAPATAAPATRQEPARTPPVPHETPTTQAARPRLEPPSRERAPAAESDTPQQTAARTVAQPTDVQGTVALKIDVESVFLNVSVRERSSNRSIPGLRKDAFRVYEDGVEQQIVQFLPTEAPFNLLLLLDVSGSTESYLHLMKEAAINFTKQIDAKDRVAVATFNSNVRLAQSFTNDRAAAENAINHIKSGGGTAFYDALMTCLDSYMKGIEGRSAIVVFTDGVDNQLQGRPGSGSRTTYDQLYRRVQESDTIIYTIFLDTEGQMQARTRRTGGYGGYPGGGYPGGRRRGGFPGGFPLPIPMPTPQPSPSPGPRGRESDAAVYEEASRQLQEIADQTGGRMYTPHKASELSGVYSEIADDLRIQYLLAYNSTNQTHDGRWRRIMVEVDNPPDTVARTRKGYYARRDSAE